MIEHLFIRNAEVNRLTKIYPLISGADVESSISKMEKQKKPNSRSVRFSSDREQVLLVAIYWKSKAPEECTSAAKWAQKIIDHEIFFWKTGSPIALVTLTELLQDAMNEKALKKSIGEDI